MSGRDETNSGEFSQSGVSPFWSSAGGLLLSLSAVLTWFSFEFVHGEGHSERPIVAIVVILLVSHATFAVAAWRAVTRRDVSTRFILTIAILARIVVLPSTPVQEDDIYRYIWDGLVVSEGLDPFAVSPLEVQTFDPERGEPAAAASYVQIRDASESRRVILQRVNHPEFVTIYPAPVQAIFSSVGVLPPETDVALYVVALKSVLAMFDIGILVLLWWLLRRLVFPAEWLIFYAWNPLILKEFYNSGHMDLIPAFFVLLACASLLARSGADLRFSGVLTAGLALGAAIATKFFALLLVPLFFWRAGGWRGVWLAVFAAIFPVATFFAFPEGADRRAETLQEFATTWEMHAAGFLWIQEIIARFVGDWQWVEALPTPEDTVIFLARIVASVLIAAVALWVAFRAKRGECGRDFLRRVFAILATLFLVGPLGNPWYFAWALVFFPFLKLRAWWLLSALLTVYYLRFSFHYRYESYGFESADDAFWFFDVYVVSAEMAIVFLALGAEWWTRRRVGLGEPAIDHSSQM
ncbi:MAG: glycosyltransferase 87 family protein [Planctomycetota bacterium]